MKKYGKVIMSTLVGALLIAASTTAAFAAGQVWNFDKDAEGWTANADLKEPTFADGKMITEKLAGDPNLTSPDKLGIDCSQNKYIVIGIKNATAENKLTIYFGAGDKDFSEETRVDAEMPANTSDVQKVAIDMSQNANWTGTLNHFRVDPGDGQETGAMEIDYIAVTNNPDEVGTAAAAAATTDTKAAASTDKAAAAAPAASTASSNPKTADAGVAVYAMMALASAAGMVVRKRK